MVTMSVIRGRVVEWYRDRRPSLPRYHSTTLPRHRHGQSRLLSKLAKASDKAGTVPSIWLASRRASERTGQATTEFLVMMALLTAVGIYLMVTMVGHDGHGGATQTMGTTTAQRICNDDAGNASTSGNCVVTGP